MSDRLLKESDVLDAILGWETDPLDEELERAVKAIPPARPKGKWVNIYLLDLDWTMSAQCSSCRENIYFYGSTSNFCPNCGADMREVDDERVDLQR